MKKVNNFESLNLKEKWCLKHILKNGAFNSLVRMDYNLMTSWNNIFKQNDLKGSETWHRIQKVLNKMVDNGILVSEKHYLRAEVSPTQTNIYVKTYQIKPYWQTKNRVELNEFHATFASKSTRAEQKYNAKKPLLEKTLK
ncbi:hypothetical protein HYO65_gp068 [Tenacibaculum phage PTm1]|uniref:Uncharacterized protein n=2 Tax=Shirahamavirus PTm1 TaxID=2846435 RepID=A0A5S9HX69_9CAUD|nr:hypothetical protein HYO65_gp068 [Tenacibaculum phage PTm1]BBI90460.1 hypothetical protein [Tenacibaculum phage PTm1]BBI90768.1 hypothetical protein [Tenacibaculum phage PTm5]